MGKRIFIALALMSCSGWEANPTHHYHLEIDPSFSADQANAIVDAATQWQLRSDSYVTFDGAASFTDVITFVPASASTLSEEFGGGTIGMANYEGQSSEIDLLATLPSSEFHQTAEHEIGHALGLIHTGAGTLMCSNAGCAAPDITSADVAQLHKN